MSQVYLIKLINNSGISLPVFSESVFSDYSKSRKTAKEMVVKLNNKLKNLSVFSPDNMALNQIIETEPDIWSNGDITIIVVAVKNNMDKRKWRNPMKNKKTFEKNIYKEFIQVA